METAPDALIVTRRQGKIALVNTQTEELFGYKREELIGQTIEMLMPERLRRRHIEAPDRLLPSSGPPADG